MIVSAGGVVIKDNRVLLLKKRGNIWVLPKGRVEQGETFEKAAVREVFEETGIEAVIQRELGWIEYEYFLFNNKLHKKVIWYQMEHKGGRILPQREEGFVDAAYIPMDEVFPLRMHKNEISVIVKAFACGSRPS